MSEPRLSKAKPLSKADARREFLRSALVWAIPGLLVLPFYLILIAISGAGGDGTLLEVTDGVKGGINAAIGPLLFVCGAVAMGGTLVLAVEAADYVWGAFALIVCWLVGWHISSRALKHIRGA